MNGACRIAKRSLNGMNSIDQDGSPVLVAGAFQRTPGILRPQFLPLLYLLRDHAMSRWRRAEGQRPALQLTFDAVITIRRALALLVTAGRFRLSMTGPREGCPSG